MQNRTRLPKWMLALPVALSMATALAPTPSLAQGFDLRSVFGNSPRQKAEEARKKREDDERRGCEQLKTWLSEAPIGIAPGRQLGTDQQAAALVLLQDARFGRAFGKTFDQMTPTELNTLTRDVLPKCVAPRGPLAEYYDQRGVIYTALGAERQAAFVRTLVAGRNANANLQSMSAELQTLQPGDAGFARLNAIHQSGDGLVKTADRDSAAAYTNALAAADARVGAPGQAAMVNDVLASAQGYDGLFKLDGTLVELRKRQPAPPGTRENEAQVRARMEQIGGELAATERQRIDVLGTGLTGLERGVQWQGEYDSRYKRFAQVRPIADLQTYFNGRRDDTLRAALPEFQSTVRRSPADEQLNAVQRRYLLPADSSTVPGTQMLSTIAEQRHEIEKRMAMGSSLEQERRETQANASTAGNGNGNGNGNSGSNSRAPAGSSQRGASNGGGSGNGNNSNNGNGNGTGNNNGEPTQEAMYDLVRSRYESEAARVRDVMKRCNSSRLSDPTDAMVCLSMSLAGGMGADQPLKITRFEKLGCSPASGKPGFYCEFMHTVSGGPTKFMGPITQSLSGDGGVSNARFLKRSDGWIMIYATER